MKEFLSQKGVQYTEKNVSTDAAARKELVDRGIAAVPVVQIGTEFVVGFKRDKLEELLV